MLSNNVFSIESHTLDGLHVADLAREAGVTPATIRYYSRTGLLHAKRDPNNDYRYFAPADVYRVQFIRKAQELGLKIADIKSIFESVDEGKAPCGKVETLVRRRLEAITRQIDELRATRDRIDGAITEWEENGNLSDEEAHFCPLIEKLGCEH